jgi:hypothetical protein
MAMTGLSGIHFLVTYRCLYQCDHCFVWGSPDQEGTMTLAQLRDVIDQAVALGTIDSVYFEGGEPMLVYPILVSAARYARERGLDIGLVTNSQYAETVEDAAVWLAPFAEPGIADLSLSPHPYFLADRAAPVAQRRRRPWSLPTRSACSRWARQQISRPGVAAAGEGMAGRARVCLPRAREPPAPTSSPARTRTSVARTPPRRLRHEPQPCQDHRRNIFAAPRAGRRQYDPEQRPVVRS